jgi:hypothetical protein
VRAVRNGITSRRPRIVIADDSTVAREGAAAIIRDLSYALCGVATDQQTTTELLEQHHPDLTAGRISSCDVDGGTVRAKGVSPTRCRLRLCGDLCGTSKSDAIYFSSN